MKILIVDDDKALRQGLGELLQRQQLQAIAASNADEADLLVRTQEFAAIILDLGLPDQDGLSLLRIWRRRGLHTPVLIVSARGAPDDRADGIQAGADDHIAKPYHARELLARVQRLLHGARDQQQSICFGLHGEYSYDISTSAVQGPAGHVSLSATLRRVLGVLVAARNRPLSKEVLLDQVSRDDDPASVNAVEQWIRRLRGKLGDTAIHTEPGLGYRLQWPRDN